MIVLATFLLLTAMTFAVRGSRQSALKRNGGEWLLDSFGLTVQGVLVPLLQTTLIYGLFSLVLPQAKGVLDVHPIVGFVLNFVVVDYLYYWNHRLLHGRGLWDTHAVHHTAERMDLFITSRNTLWSSLLIVYVWVNGLFIFLLRDSRAFILAVSITASLDLWRHTAFTFKPDSAWHRVLGVLFITPSEHAWHHSTNKLNNNFGANLSVWDKLHGTYFSPAEFPQRFGIRSDLTLTRKFLFPFQTGKVVD
jgi:sterol desaturase/sphingolipid hydroxylase (fatty acid hydroxylase superfamily)